LAKKEKNRSRGLKARYNHSVNTRDSGSAFSSAFKWSELDQEVKFFKPKENVNLINIIPFEVKSKKHPLVLSGDMEIGDIDYVMDIYLHRSVGPADKEVVCLKKNYGKACPICEEAEKFRKAGKDDEYDALKPSRRVLYNVVDLKAVDDILVFKVSHHLFEKELIEEARSQSGDGEIVYFSDIEEGSAIKFRRKMDKFKKTEFMKYKSFEFKEREEELDEDLIDEAISFDEIMEVLSYSEIQNVLYGEDEDTEGETENDDDSEDTEEEDEKPKKKKAQKKKAKKVKAGDKCPHGHSFGKDTDQHEECDDCELWEEYDDA